jgi:drug/metabolite transporter (DMT)-like permease
MAADQAALLFAAAHNILCNTRNRRRLKGALIRGLKTPLGGTALLAGLALAPAANAQIVVDLGVQPMCSYGYYDYTPYACEPIHVTHYTRTSLINA